MKRASDQETARGQPPQGAVGDTDPQGRNAEGGRRVPTSAAMVQRCRSGVENHQLIGNRVVTATHRGLAASLRFGEVQADGVAAPQKGTTHRSMMLVAP